MISYRTKYPDNSKVSGKALEILHEEGIESAEAWLKRIKTNEFYDRIEDAYFRTKKIVYIN
jgi:hypothetical protein